METAQQRNESICFRNANFRSQISLCQAMVPVLKIMDTIKSDTVPNKVKEVAGDTFKILAHTIVQSNELRTEKLKQDLLPEYWSLCSNKPSATKLFGDKLAEDIEALKESKSNLTSTAMTTKKPLFSSWEGANNNYQSFQHRRFRGGTHSHPVRHNRNQTTHTTNHYRNHQTIKQRKTIRK